MGASSGVPRAESPVAPSACKLMCHENYIFVNEVSCQITQGDVGVKGLRVSVMSAGGFCSVTRV